MILLANGKGGFKISNHLHDVELFSLGFLGLSIGALIGTIFGIAFLVWLLN
jgi:hypothetical protein